MKTNDNLTDELDDKNKVKDLKNCTICVMLSIRI